MPNTPSVAKASKRSCPEISQVDAEILTLKLQLITAKATKDNLIEEMELMVLNSEGTKIEMNKLRRDLSGVEKDLEVSQTEVASLKRELKKKEPLYQVGVAVRLGFMDAANRIRIKSRSQVVHRDLHTDRAVLQAKVDGTPWQPAC